MSSAVGGTSDSGSEGLSSNTMADDSLSASDRKTIQTILAQLPKLEKSVLFGSRAMGTHTASSDIDLALYGDNLTLQDVARLASDLEDTSLPVSVDLLRYETITSEALKEHIKRYGKMFWEKIQIKVLPKTWKITSLGDACKQSGGNIQTGPFGSQLHSCDYVQNGIPSIMPQNIGDNRISEKDIARITEKDAARLSKYRVQIGDIVYSRRGDVEKRALIRKHQNGWLCGTGCLRIRTGAGELNSVYLSYFLGHPRTREWIVQHAIGATMPNLNTAILSALPIILPPLPEQRAIASILGALDDKIELNNRINKTLEEMAQAIFKEWFVDFGPFQDGEFVDSELGRIPKGWRVGTIEDLGSVVGGSTPSKACPEYYTNDGIAWLTPKDLSTNKDKFISRGDIDITSLGLKNSSVRILPRGSVLFSSRAPIGYIAIAKNKITTNQGFKSVVPNRNVGTAYIYYFLKFNLERIENMASGSTFKEVSGSVMKKVEALIPNYSVLKNFSSVCASIFEKQKYLETENREIAITRVALLPKLMSGEIRIPVEN
jgi:type I restriction enzyme S subunit